MRNTYSYPYDSQPTIYQQRNQNQNQRKNNNNEYDSEEDSSDVVFLGQSGPIQPVTPNEIVQNLQNNAPSIPNVVITKCVNEDLLVEINKIIYNPEKLHSILSRLNGVNPNDPIFDEFYNNENCSKS